MFKIGTRWLQISFTKCERATAHGHDPLTTTQSVLMATTKSVQWRRRRSACTFCNFLVCYLLLSLYLSHSPPLPVQSASSHFGFSSFICPSFPIRPRNNKNVNNKTINQIDNPIFRHNQRAAIFFCSFCLLPLAKTELNFVSVQCILFFSLLVEILNFDQIAAADCFLYIEYSTRSSAYFALRKLKK